MERNEIRLKVPWGHVAAKTWGSPENYPVLVIHGVMDNAAAFDRLIPLLGKEFYYVCIDLPGHGYSSHFPNGVPLEFLNYVYCIKLVLDELDWKNCVSIGHSLGSMLIHLYTFFYPGIIKKYVSIDSPVLKESNMHEIKSRFLKIYSSANDYTISKNSELFTREEVIYALQTKRMQYLKKEAAEAMFERSVTEVDGRFKYNRDSRLKVVPRMKFLSSDQVLKLFSIETVPTLFIVASTKPSFLKERGLRDEMLDIIKRKKLVKYVIVEGNHDLHNNHPERVAPLVVQFLKKIDSKL